jgi:hypothetical protein
MKKSCFLPLVLLNWAVGNTLIEADLLGFLPIRPLAYNRGLCSYIALSCSASFILCPKNTVRVLQFLELDGIQTER